MANMSYCRFENTARDLADCVQALNTIERYELSSYEIDGLKDILDLAEKIIEDKEYIQGIINND